ncbi:MAG: DEAD/DEAH box helicase, partial [Chloroflexota bacterium]
MEADVPSLLDRLRAVFNPVQILDLPLKIEMDADDNGRQTVRIGYAIDGETTWVQDVTKLWQYGGFSVEQDGKKYVVSVEDQDTLLAIYSVRAEAKPTGELVFDVLPGVLGHLRQRSVVRETEESREYQILDDPLQLGADVDYDPDEGMTAEVGYRDPDTGELIPQPNLDVTPDGRYARAGKRFIPLPKAISEKAADWLDRVRTVVAPDRIPEFFKRDLVLLQTEFQAVLTDSASRVKVVDLPDAPRVRVESDGRGWLDFQLGYTVEGHEIPFDRIWDSRGGTIRPDEHTFMQVPKDKPKGVLKELTAMAVQETATGFRLPIAQFASLEDFIKHIGGQREVNAAYDQFLAELKDFEADENHRLSEAAEERLRQEGIILRPYQRAGIHWLTWLIEHHLHGLLADDMGLGKTIQAAAALRHARESSESRLHSLIVCPKSVIRHWSRELRKCDLWLQVYEYIGSNRDRDMWTRSVPGVAISTYATAARDVDIISQIPLFFLVLDESTKIKNPDTQRAQAVKSLNAAHRIALSGTPVENRPAELWSVFDFLMRGHLGRYGTFQREFEAPILEGRKSAAQRLGERVGPFVLRRRKEHVEKDLPDKIPMDEWIDLTDEQRNLYVAFQNRDAEPVRRSLAEGAQINYPGILAILTKLKQVCDHPALVTGEFEPIEGRSEKFDRILELITEIAEGDELVVLFTQWLDMLDLYEQALKGKNLRWIRLDGSVPMA